MNFPHLTVLKLQGTSVDDLAMEQVGIHCPKLAYLDMADTTFSDQGLAYLTTTDQGRPAGERLAQVDLRNTAVTAAGLARFIDSHRNIVRIGFESFDEVLDCLQAEEGGGEKELQLREIFFVNCRGNVKTIEKCRKFCPYLDSFRFVVYCNNHKSDGC